MSTILITGINGFVGQHLAKELVENNYKIVGVGGNNIDVKLDHLIHYSSLDLTKRSETSKIDFSNIDGVIHLAGLAAVGPSFDNPKLYMDVNVGIEINLFEEALKQKKKPKFLIISSGSIYNPKAPLPLTETSAVSPNSPYSVSKLAQEQMAAYYGSRGFEYVIARPFNHIGPGQSLGFIVPDLAEQIIRSKEIFVGNLSAKRDYTDVRDIVKAYRLLLEKGTPSEVYNVCSGVTHDGHEILNFLIEVSGKKLTVKKDPDKLRPSDTPLIVGSYEKLNKDTGWRPSISLKQTLVDVIKSLK